MQLKVYDANFSARQKSLILDCLSNDGVIIYPTDTIYALGCSLYSRKAIDKISRIKQKDGSQQNYALVCADLSHLSDYCRQINNRHFKIMKALLPGPYTFILKANAQVPKIFRSKKKTIGIRVPDNEIARALVELVGHPLISSSIPSDEEYLEYSTDPELMFEKYNEQIDLVLNAGIGKLDSSTVVDFSVGDEPIILRQGIGPFEF